MPDSSSRSCCGTRKVTVLAANLERQVQHVQKLEGLGVLAGGIAHDFNNLLTSILGHAELAILEVEPGGQIHHSLAEIQIAGARASELCRQMLAYSGKATMNVDAVDLNELVQEMATLLELSVSKKAVVTFQPGEGLPAINADSTQLQQIVMNLIINASESGDQGDVKILLRTGRVDNVPGESVLLYNDDSLADGPYVYFEVVDDGSGMDEETYGRIFDPFFSTKFTGRGLGLAAVLGIVRSHNGGIQVTSSPGQGTHVRVLFPATNVVSSPHAAGNGEARDWRGTGTILLADDEPSGARSREAVPIARGLRCHHGDGRRGGPRAGIEKHADEVVCAVLDLTMQGWMGLEASRAMRQIQPDLVIVLCSGFSEQDLLGELARGEISAFLAKPFVYSMCLRPCGWWSIDHRHLPDLATLTTLLQLALDDRSQRCWRALHFTTSSQSDARQRASVAGPNGGIARNSGRKVWRSCCVTALSRWDNG